MFWGLGIELFFLQNAIQATTLGDTVIVFNHQNNFKNL